ncbi:hypothetical protein EWB00_009966 [Schistosoma japonicum]|uniref:Uncharacterized protein n=1 Tax=Schistosoma japonicum TaxID=6182 RepID=A0A4Z2CLP8_SCHJA|nr:hypothetical protein EWB00_009966 [Schistosoma japonicum]
MIRSHSLPFIKPTEDGLLNLIDFKSHNYYEIHIISEYQECDFQSLTNSTFNHPVVIKSDTMNGTVALRKFNDIQKMITFLQESCKFASELTVNNETDALESTTGNTGNAKSTNR